MNIICNGTERKINTGAKLVDLLKELDLAVETVVVECDGIILKREEYDIHELREGSVVELIRFVGGG